MPTLVSESKTIRHELWTADDFLDWLEPGIHADLIDGEIIRSIQVPGFLLHRAWLDPDKLPEVAGCLAQIEADQ